MQGESIVRKITPALKESSRFGIAVVGVGGGGGNVVDHLSQEGVEDVEFFAINTDRQALDHLSDSLEKIQIGESLCDGEGAGGDPAKAKEAAQQSSSLLASKFTNKRLIFIVTCLGGGTGSGASPAIAEIARRQNPNVLLVGLVTKPTGSDRDHTVHLANEGIVEMREVVNAMTVIPNDKKGTGMVARYREVNELLLTKIKSFTRLLVETQVPNIDMADIKNTLISEEHVPIDMFIGTASNESNQSTSTEEGRSSNFDQLLKDALSTDWLEIDFSNPLADAPGILSFTLGGNGGEGEDITDRAYILEQVEKLQTGAQHLRLKISYYIDQSLAQGTVLATAILRAAYSDGQLNLKSDTADNQVEPSGLAKIRNAAMESLPSEEVGDIGAVQGEDFTKVVAEENVVAAVEPENLAEATADPNAPVTIRKNSS